MRKSEQAKNTLYCSFCHKSQHEVKKLIAAEGGVFICDDCTDVCAEIVFKNTKPEDFEKTFPSFAKSLKSLKVFEGLKVTIESNNSPHGADKILRSIEFMPEHRQAGIGILNYFTKYLAERYPDISVKVAIEQDDNKVRMVIESGDGTIETVEQTLEEYALIITGKASAADFLTEKYQIMELNQKLEMAAMEIRWQNRFITALEHDKASQRDFFVKQIEQLNRSVALGITNSTKLISALERIIKRPMIDPSVLAAVERITTSLREERPFDENEVREDLATIARESPSILRELFDSCVDGAMGAAGNLLATWISPLVNLFPR